MKTMMRGLTLAAVLLTGVVTQAELVIDNFDQNFSISGISTTGLTALNDGVAGTREVSLGSVGGLSSVTATAGNTLTTTIATLNGTATFNYLFTTPLDLHSSGPGLPYGNPLILDLFDSVNGAFQLTATYYSGANSAAFANYTINAAGVRYLDGTTLGNGALASSVDRVNLRFQATALENVGFDTYARFQAAGALLHAVPEPATMSLLGLTAIGGIFAHRRRKNQLAA